MIKYIKSVIRALAIFWMIGLGVTLNNSGYHFWGYLNALVGGFFVYMLCLNYFKNEKPSKTTNSTQNSKGEKIK